MVAAAVAGGAIVGGVASSAIGGSAAKSAANTQADAANNAAQLQWQQFQQLQQNLAPYMQLGQNAIPTLQGLLTDGRLNPQFSFNPTEQQLEQTPGYQFTLQQGLKGVDNAASAKGLNLSGAQLKGIGQYTTGLADQTYQQQYQNALQNFQTNYGVSSDLYNRYAGLVGLGQNAAAGIGNAGLQTANQAGNFLTSGANASAAGQIGAANAINGGIGSISQGAGLYGLLGGGFGGAPAANNIYGQTAAGNPIYFQ
jgi:hypothetical protein